jgi:hypothetical protein
VTTLRTRIPVLLCMLMDKGIEIEFTNHIGEPLMGWRNRKTKEGGHAHLSQHARDEYGARAIEIEEKLVMILADTNPEASVAGE